IHLCPFDVQIGDWSYPNATSALPLISRVECAVFKLLQQESSCLNQFAVILIGCFQNILQRNADSCLLAKGAGTNAESKQHHIEKNPFQSSPAAGSPNLLAGS